jgi:hypothetical protein
MMAMTAAINYGESLPPKKMPERRTESRLDFGLQKFLFSE